MKKYFAIFIFFFAITLNIFSQIQYRYYQVYSGTTNDLKDIKYIYPSLTYKYFICGDNGTLLKIAGGDSTCIIVPNGTTANLNGIMNILSGYNPYLFFILSNNGFYLKSTYTGNIWTLGYSGFSNNLYSGLYMTSYGPYGFKYYAVGSNGMILRKRFYYPASDTGWYQVQSGTTNDLKSINTFRPYYPYNDYNPFAWIAGNNGTILKTIDTGHTWTKQVSGTTKNLNCIYFRTIDSGFAVGESGLILSTTNGGTSWLQKESHVIQNLNCIYSYYSSDIYIAGDKVILFSTNKGESWNIDTAAPKYNFYSGNYLYSNYYQRYVPFFVGEAGKVYKKTFDTTFHPNINVQLDGNNINAWFARFGVFDQDFRTTNTPGFEWPKGSNKHAVFTAGLCIGAFVNNQLKQASASYKGEYSKGYCELGIFKTSENFKYYKVSRGDNAQNNWDWANWGLMVPYGAPFIDVNNNGIYEPAIDTPGVKNAVQTIFYCMTDADSTSHTSGEGFGGGTRPIYAEVHLTAWVYNTPGLEDVQFINYDIINKGVNNWNRVKMGIFIDSDLGDANDDYSGCDTNLKLTYTYNGDNDDPVYGLNPPAVGFTVLTSPVNKSVTPHRILGMTSSISPFKYVPCESDPNGEPLPAYYMLSGYKKDSTSFLDPTYNPPKKTKYCYHGDVETNTGWTEFKGSIGNCHLDSTGTVISLNPKGDKRQVMGSGADDFNIAPGDTQRFCIAQMIARGSSNLNSVTVLKNLCANVRTFYETNFPFVITPKPIVEIPQYYSLSQNYPNPFNADTRIKFEVPRIDGLTTNSTRITIKVYDMLGREVKTLINADYYPGKYEVVFDGRNFASGAYIYRLTSKEFYSVKRMVLVK